MPASVPEKVLPLDGLFGNCLPFSDKRTHEPTTSIRSASTIPTHWYNLLADFPEPRPVAPRHQTAGHAEMMTAIFPGTWTAGDGPRAVGGDPR
jgi:hypothetical protein